MLLLLIHGSPSNPCPSKALKCCGAAAAAAGVVVVVVVVLLLLLLLLVLFHISVALDLPMSSTGFVG